MFTQLGWGNAEIAVKHHFCVLIEEINNGTNGIH